jgi:hypothetical protein
VAEGTASTGGTGERSLELRFLRRRHVVRAIALLALGAAAGAQAPAFTARLSTVPITVAMQETVTGRGAVTATLSGQVLTIQGTFEGLRSPATVARLHLSPRGTRGAPIADLVVSNAVKGTITGSVKLTGPQVDALESSGLYIQLHSQKAPEGNLWGWLLPQEVKR